MAVPQLCYYVRACACVACPALQPPPQTLPLLPTSLVQQFFMAPALREGLLQVEPPLKEGQGQQEEGEAEGKGAGAGEGKEEEDPVDVVRELQRTFM